MAKKQKERILVVDDSPDTLELIARNLQSRGYTVHTASGVADALNLVENAEFDLIITDMKMPEVNGFDLIRYVQENLPDTMSMMITGYASVDSAVKAVKTGAEEFISKPFTDDELFSAVERTLDKLRSRYIAKTTPTVTDEPYYGMVGNSEAMLKTYAEIEKAAETDATVLVSGESGTGKELVARAIHYASKQAQAPFVPVNCGAIPSELLESELFGYVKGAFTGANDNRAGFFQTADGGTIFLDEISETTLAMQVKLLRVLQEREVYMVGSREAQQVDIRVIAATNKDLLNSIERETFRDDLYYRLAVITFDLPPLRDRGEDILSLCGYFLGKYSEKLGKPAPKISDDALSALGSYNWPGNVRELENIIHRLIVMDEDGLIGVKDLPPLMKFRAPGGTSLNKTLDEVDLDHIRNVLAAVNGNKSRAASILGIDRKTLREKMKKIDEQS